ncbi:hypothetical protein HYW21_05195 [Candidatus Woesearchaeota archaeon]|nr:hypothetical protein [Candidatus Woesearchaeota archaeon]
MGNNSFVCWVDTPPLGAALLFDVCCSQQTLKIPRRLWRLGFLFVFQWKREYSLVRKMP